MADEGLVEHLETLQKRQSVVSLPGGRVVCLSSSQQWSLFLQEQSVRGNIPKAIAAEVRSLSRITSWKAHTAMTALVAGVLASDVTCWSQCFPNREY